MNWWSHLAKIYANDYLSTDELSTKKVLAMRIRTTGIIISEIVRPSDDWSFYHRKNHRCPPLTLISIKSHRKIPKHRLWMFTWNDKICSIWLMLDPLEWRRINFNISQINGLFNSLFIQPKKISKLCITDTLRGNLLTRIQMTSNEESVFVSWRHYCDIYIKI